MSNVSQTIANSLQVAIEKVVQNINAHTFEEWIYDLHLQYSEDEGTLSFFDEHETLLHSCNVETKDHEEVIREVKQQLFVMKNNQTFDQAPFAKPFSVSLINESFQSIEELLFIDNETILLNEPLLENLDTDLDQFLKNLLEE